MYSPDKLDGILNTAMPPHHCLPVEFAQTTLTGEFLKAETVLLLQDPAGR
jgi:hypothetical protein